MTKREEQYLLRRVADLEEVVVLLANQKENRRHVLWPWKPAYGTPGYRVAQRVKRRAA
jgi:hypothetical protein